MKRSMTMEEQKRLLLTMSRHRDGFRDHVIISLALGTALREFEIAALTCGDVYNARGKPRERVQLRVYKNMNRPRVRRELQQVFLPDSVKYLLTKFRRWKKQAGQPLEEYATLFQSLKGGPLSTRQYRRMFKRWQEEAEVEPAFSFHELRHTALQNIWNKTGGNLLLVQRVARHASVTTTTMYAQPSDEQIAAAVRGL